MKKNKEIWLKRLTLKSINDIIKIHCGTAVGRISFKKKISKKIKKSVDNNAEHMVLYKSCRTQVIHDKDTQNIDN